ncbi:MAG: DUF4352 domain-containing protein [Lachnospiraceae bacterium]|nr:DUF4352 domain-containing protein [Lachnospiraceae bacterium]
MKKKYIISMVTVASAVVLTSCASQVPELSELDNNKAAEYMAGEMLKYDEDYALALDYDRSILEATPTPAPTPKQVATPKPVENSKDPSSSAPGDIQGEEPAVQEVSGAEIFGISGIEIKYISASVRNSYGKGYESIVASKGKDLLIVKFRIKNTGQDTKKIDLFDQKLDYILSQGERTIKPEHTTAVGDLQYLKTEISPGKSKQGVLLFEVDKGAQIEGSSLRIINEMKQTTITLS